jgi:o-succinylbenzoate---CoA ligase
MEQDKDWIYTLFSHRLGARWLVNFDGDVVINLANQKLAEFRQSQPHFILIATANPIELIANLMAGLRLGIPIFLANPLWGKAEWAEVAVLTAQINREQHQNLIMIPTGGSSGSIKFVIHTWETLSASVWGFQEFYDVNKINTVCTLPLYHVSGLIQIFRSLLTDGQLLIINFHQLCENPSLVSHQIDRSDYFISLVPTQLSKLLDLDFDWLVEFQTILLGGAPPTMELLTRARIAGLRVAATYGMTETGSQISSLKPTEFLAGNNSCGRVLPHVEIELLSSIRIRSKSLMLGYFPDLDRLSYFDSDDLGVVDSSGYLTILGRNSGKIITGGENVFPIEIINAIMSTGLVADVWVFGSPDRYWGQIVTAIYVENHHLVSGAILSSAIATQLSKYKIPKRWIPVSEIPRNSLGKVSSSAVAALVKSIVF